MYANPPFIRELFKKLASDWLSAGSNVVASESMIFVFEFNSKPFAYSPKRNFLSTFSHSLSCVDCILCRTAPLTAASRIVLFNIPPSLSWPIRIVKRLRRMKGSRDGHLTAHGTGLKSSYLR
ncbi:hypothetical protein ABFA07_005634 [Porites harrisoni]